LKGVGSILILTAELPISQDFVSTNLTGLNGAS